MNTDQVTIRINQLKELHKHLNEVYLESERVYSVNPTEDVVLTNGVTEILNTAMVALQLEINNLTNQVAR